MLIRKNLTISTTNLKCTSCPFIKPYSRFSYYNVVILYRYMRCRLNFCIKINTVIVLVMMSIKYIYCIDIVPIYSIYYITPVT